MSERCPDYFPGDWTNPHIVRGKYYDIKEYEDGVRAIIEEADYMPWIDGQLYLVNPAIIETHYPDRGLHYEHHYDDNGNLVRGPKYIPEGIPEDADI